MKKRRIVSACLIASLFMTNISWMQQDTKADIFAGVGVGTEIADQKVNANSFAENFVNIIPSLKLTPNYGWTTNGAWVSMEGNENGYGKMVATAPNDYVPVVQGETYVISINRIYWIYDKGTHVLFTDDDMKPIACDDIDYTKNLSNQIVNVPAGATRMYITYYCNQTFRLDKIVGSTNNKDAITLATDESKLIYDAVLKEETADKEFSYKFDKAKVTFVLDDVRGDVNLVYDIFKDYGFKNICIAAIPEGFSQLAAGANRTRGEVIDDIVENGGEVLAHYGEQLTKDTYTKTEIKKRFKETKEKLEAYGYDVNGIILAGGNDCYSIDFDDVEKWARYYYDYSDLYGMNEPYRRGRASFAYSYTTQARFEEAIDGTIEKKGWMVLYMHDLNEMPEEKLRERLAYIKKCVNAGSIDVVTYKKLNDDYGIKNNGTTVTEYSAIDYLVREDIDGYLEYSDQKKIEKGVNEYYTENLLQDNSVECKDIYISSSTGDDSNAGTIDAPKKSLEGLNKVNNLHIYLKSGDTFDLSKSFEPGNNVSLNSYNEDGKIGVGKRPILNGWDELKGTWSKTSVPNVWEFDFSAISKLVTKGKLNGNTGMLRINGAVNFERYIFEDDVDTAEYAQRIADLEKEVLIKDEQFIPFWTIDSVNSKIYLYSGVNPSEENIEYGAPYFGMSIGNVSNVGVNHVEITGFSRHGISMSGASKVNVTDCYINYIGGGLLNEGNLSRYGNAVEVWANGKDIYVGENIANWIFDTAYTNQTTGSNITQENITFERNIANRCYWGLESWGDNCNVEGFKDITYRNNIVTNICDVTRPDLECYYGNGFKNYNENGKAMDGTKPYISCRSGLYFYSQMAGISAAVSSDKTSLKFAGNAILFSNRYTAILSTTSTGKFPAMQGNLMYSALPNDECNMIRGKTPEDTFFSFYEELPGENNKVIAEHGAELVHYSDIIKETSKYLEQCYEYPIIKITSITFDVDKKLFETGSSFDCNVISAKYVYNDGSFVNIEKSDYEFDTSKVNINKPGMYKIYLTAINPENGEKLKDELTVEVSSDLSRFVWDEGTADNGNTRWVIRKNGDLYIESGSSNYGGIAQYAKASDAPWYSYSDKVENVYINQNYHYVSNFFDSTAAVKKIYINSNVSGTINFGDTPNLEDIVVADGATVNAISLNGKTKMTTYDFSKIKGELNGIQLVMDTALEEATFYTLPTNNAALYRNPSLKRITILNAPKDGVGLEDAFMHVTSWNKSDGVEVLCVGWLKGEVENAPWGLKGNFIISYADYDVTYEDGVEKATAEHDYGEFVSDGNVSCTKDGKLIKTCKTCGTKYEVVEEKLGHNYVGGKCTRCGKTSETPSSPEKESVTKPVTKPDTEEKTTSSEETTKKQESEKTTQKPTEKLSIKISSVKASLVVGEKKTLKVTNNKTKKQVNVTWKSSNKKIAKVSSKGVVTAIKSGKVKITATAKDGQKKVCNITVKKAPKKLMINKSKLVIKKGKKFKITCAVTMGTYTKFKFSSSNKRVVKITSKGTLTALKKGKATITVKTLNGLKKKCRVVVK